MKKNVIFFAQQVYYPWIEWVKNNSIKICEWLNKKIKVNIISHKSHENNLNKDNIYWVNVNYLLRLSDNKVLQLFYLISWAFSSLLFVLKSRPEKIYIQYLDASYLLALVLIKISNPKLPLILTLYSTDEVTTWYKNIFLKYFWFKKIIIISEYLRDYVLELWYKNENIIYIPLSFDKTRYLRYSNFENRKKKIILFSAWIKKEAWSFLMVDLAKIMPEYNFIFALRKFNKKSEEELFLLEKYIDKRWVSNIEIKRNIERMEKLLAWVSSLILPLQDMNIKMLVPVALLEAMWKWTICFVSNLPHLEKLVDNNKNAIIFNKDDIYELKEKILDNISNKIISENAFNFAKRYPNFDEIVESYYKIV